MVVVAIKIDWIPCLNWRNSWDFVGRSRRGLKKITDFIKCDLDTYAAASSNLLISARGGFRNSNLIN